MTPQDIGEFINPFKPDPAKWWCPQCQRFEETRYACSIEVAQASPMTQPGAREPMTPDDAARAKAAEFLKSLWPLDLTDTGEAFGHDVNLALAFAAQVAQRAVSVRDAEWGAILLQITGGNQSGESAVPCPDEASIRAFFLAQVEARCHPTPELHDRKE